MTTSPIVCDLSSAEGGFVLTPEAPPPPKARPVLRDVYYVAIARRTLAEVVPIVFSSLGAANRFAKGARTDPDVMAVEVSQLTRRHTAG